MSAGDQTFGTVLNVAVPLALWLAFALLFCPSPWDERQVWLGGDQALLLADADSTLDGNPPLTGAYSKASLHHPGPMFTYFLAIVQAATGRSVALTNAVVTFTQAATLPVLAAFAYRVSHSWPVSLSLPLLIVFNVPFLLYMRIIWNVAIVTPLLAFAIWLVWETDTAARWTLPLLVVVLSFMAQAHMAFLPLAVSLGLLATCRWLSGGIAGKRRWAALAGAVALLCWAPVLWDVLAHGGGNIAAVAAYFGAQDMRQTPAAIWGALRALGREALPPLVPVAPTVALATVFLIWGAWKEHHTPARLRPLLAMLAVAWAVVWLSLRGVPGEIDLYYLRPASVLLIVHLVGGVAGLISLVPRPAVATTIAATAAALTLAVIAPPAIAEWTRFRSSEWNDYPLHELRAVANAIDVSRQQGAGSPGHDATTAVRLDFDPPDLAGAAASIHYLLHRSGLHASASAAAAPRYRIVHMRSTASRERRGVMILRTKRYLVERLDLSAEFDDKGRRCPAAHDPN